MTAPRVRDTNVVRDSNPEKLAKVNLFESARLFADVWVLRPGQSQAPHRHEREDKLYHVLSGRGRVRSGAEEHDVGPGQLAWCPAGEDHGVTALGPDDLRLLVVMAPHPKPPAAP